MQAAASDRLDAGSSKRKGRAAVQQRQEEKQQVVSCMLIPLASLRITTIGESIKVVHKVLCDCSIRSSTSGG
jgi:hypothetical protein